MKLSFTTNIDKVFADLDALQAAIVRDAVPLWLNDLGDKAKTTGVQTVRDIYGISTRDTAPYLEVSYGNAARPRWELRAKGYGFPLKLFHPRQTPKGVVVTIKGRPVLFPHAFIVKATGHVWARGTYQGNTKGGTYTGNTRKRTGGFEGKAQGSPFEATGETMGRFQFGRNRFPISILRTFSIPNAFGNDEVVQAMQTRIEDDAAKVLANKIKLVRYRR